jgi:hypothetical protein
MQYNQEISIYETASHMSNSFPLKTLVIMKEVLCARTLSQFPCCQHCVSHTTIFLKIIRLPSSLHLTKMLLVISGFHFKSTLEAWVNLTCGTCEDRCLDGDLEI